MMNRCEFPAITNSCLFHIDQYLRSILFWFIDNVYEFTVVKTEQILFNIFIKIQLELNKRIITT
jgi:hypothetical protein